MKAEWFKRWDDKAEDDVEIIEVDSSTGYFGQEEEEETDNRSGWWSQFHGGGKSRSYTPVKSTSAYLRSHSGSQDNGRRADRNEDLLEVIKEVNKTINLTINSDGGKDEKNLSVRYSDGCVVNDLSSPILYVSPKVLMDDKQVVHDKSSDAYYAGLDALNGQAMLCSFMRKSVGRRANYQYQSCDNWAVRNLYMTDLQSTAGNEIYSDWPGFRSYVDSQQKVFNQSREAIMGAFASPDQNIDNFVNLICHNRLSQDRIDYHDYFQTEIADRLDAADCLLNETMDTPCENDERFQRSSDLYNQIQQLLDLTQPPPQQQPQDGDDEQDDDQQQDGQPQGSKGQNDDDSDSDGQDGDADGDADGDGQDADGDGDSDSDSDADGGNSNNPGKGRSTPGNGKGKPKTDIQSIDTNSNSPKNREFTGDNSYNETTVAGDYAASHIDPSQQLREREQHQPDALRSIQDKQLEGATYTRIVPPVNPETRERYKRVVSANRGAISRVKNCFDFHNTDFALSSYGLTVGGLDEQSLHKVQFGETERLYERKDILAKKKWLVTLLIDQSGSMAGRKMEQARELAIIFSEALKSLRDTDFSVYGFSTGGNTRINTYCYKDTQTKKLEALSEACEHQNTGLGFHIAHVGDKMLKQYPNHENRILFVITDGEPNMTPTPTMNGYQHTAHCCNLLRKRGINVYGIGIANAFGDPTGQQLFGNGNYTVLNDVRSTLNVLTNRLRNFFKKMKR
jgi:hypothetical protein